MTEPQRVVTKRVGGVLLVTLSRPERLNALSPLMVEQLSQAWTEAADGGVRAVVLTGAGRGFCAGADLNPDEEEQVIEPDGLLRRRYNPMLLQLDALGKPVVAAVNGPAAGAGLGLALAADVRLASPTAVFVPAFSRIGVVPDMGVSFHAPRILGHATALEWLLRGDRWSAEQALAKGLVSAVCAPEDLLHAAVELAASLAASTPTAVRLTRELICSAPASTLAHQLECEERAQRLAMADPARAALRAAATRRPGTPH